MKDIEVKKEIEVTDNIDDCIPELTKLLEEVKREEVDENEAQCLDVEEILKNVAKDESSDSADDADIQKLQELLKEKQKELKESDEKLKRKSQTSSTPDRSNGRKKKKHERKRKTENDTENEQQEKRKKENSSQNESPNNNESLSNQNQDTPFPNTQDLKEESAMSVKMERLPTEEELENLLQPSDHSDEEPCNSNSIMNAESAEQEVSVCTSPIPFRYDVNPSNDFYNFYNADSSFNAAHAEGFQVPEEEDELQCLPVINSAGFSGMPTFKRIKLERPVSDQNEENVDIIDETPKDKRKKIFSTCMSILECLEFSEPSGKFIFTPTITKSDCSAACNSILQKISNVHYDFQSIGPNSNLSDWGLKAIGGANGKIAKAIGISADAYFSKIKQKSDTMTGKLIKVETDRGEKRKEIEIENEEPNLSTFFKSSVTQTDPLVCQKCVARNRIVGHDVGVQAKAYASSIGSQTYSTGDNHSELSAGLSENQLRALYKFSFLIRESSVNPSIEMFQTRAMDIFKIIQNESQIRSSSYHGLSRDSSRERPDPRRTLPLSGPSYATQTQQPVQMQMSYSHERTNLRPVPSVGVSRPGHMPPAHMPPTHMPPAHMPPPHNQPAQSFHPPSHTMPHVLSRDPRQSMNPSPPAHVQPTQSFHPPSHTMSHVSSRDLRQSMNTSPPQAYWNPSLGDNFPNYQTHGIPGPLNHPPNGNFPNHQGSTPINYGYPPAVKDTRVSYGRGHRM